LKFFSEKAVMGLVIAGFEAPLLALSLVLVEVVHIAGKGALPDAQGIAVESAAADVVVIGKDDYLLHHLGQVIGWAVVA